MYKLFGTVNSLELLDDFWRFYNDFGEKNNVNSAFLLLFPKIMFAKVTFNFFEKCYRITKNRPILTILNKQDFSIFKVLRLIYMGKSW